MIGSRLGAVLALAAVLSCAGAPSEPLGSGSITVPSGVTFTVIPAKPVFGPGEPVEAVLRVENASPQPVRFEFRTGCQAFFQVASDGGVVFNSPLHLACILILTSFELAPGESKSIPFRWDRRDDAGAEVPPGLYRITAALADGNSPPVSATVELQ
ncbi:MAG: BsuPI-related putative proteinase inhibitor [Gemmatimonadales bacterium]